MSQRSIVELTFAFYPKGYRMTGASAENAYSLLDEARAWKKPYEETTKELPFPQMKTIDAPKSYIVYGEPEVLEFTEDNIELRSEIVVSDTIGFHGSCVEYMISEGGIDDTLGLETIWEIADKELKEHFFNPKKEKISFGGGGREIEITTSPEKNKEYPFVYRVLTLWDFDSHTDYYGEYDCWVEYVGIFSPNDIKLKPEEKDASK